MARDKVPAFQFYPKDFLTDERVRLMSHTERGVYITLLCFCWLEGTLPLETHALAKLVELPLPRFAKLWERSVVKQCFLVNCDGRMHHKRLDEERVKQVAFQRRQTDAAAARWGRHTDAMALPDLAFPTLSPRVGEGEEKKVLEEKNLENPPAPLKPDGLEARGGWLVERYGDLYRQHRHGARFRQRPHLDWQEAMDLCRVWDHARLEKLAVLVLTTDDEFISKTDRSFKIFAMKATWADDKLRQWELANEVPV